MVDTLTSEERSERMRRIRSSNTKPEVLLRKALHARGLRFRLHDQKLPGKPDAVFAQHRVALFVHGCFWHRHEGCKVATTPKSNTQFWVEKFQRNVARDARVRRELEAAGWRVVIVWECEANTPVKAAETAERLRTVIKGGDRQLPTTEEKSAATARVLDLLRDRFSSPEEALHWMENGNVPGYGVSAIELIVEGHTDWVYDVIMALDAGVYQ